MNVTPTQSVTSSSGIGGFNLASPLSLYGITGTTFTINGQAISVNPVSDGLSNIISRINASSAGVIATFNQASGQIQLVSKATEPKHRPRLPTDSSNFLGKTGLKGGGFNPTIQVGQQAQVSYLNQSGAVQTVFSNSNTLNDVIAGISLNLVSGTNTPYNVQVAADSSGLTGAIGTFITAYNAAIQEINIATAPPVVKAPTAGNLVQAGVAQSQQLTTGGPLYDNFSVRRPSTASSI